MSVKLSEILTEARADIADPERWYKGNWVERVYDVTSEQELMEVGAVCAVTSLARVCVRHHLVTLAFQTEDRSCDCNCPNCDGYRETEDSEFDVVMDDFRHESLDLLDAAADELYKLGMTSLNDSQQHGHADVLLAYDRAIELAIAKENGG